ncbi:MAG: GUN4 domain-containing protein [Symploca sp. SIO1C4]|uniref:GUN4 domain-containing protein n=1 Tax=Symploca sp. SIO1C4 TaxID=2607765 RepID=A0A6B3ND58_9CYAN|nr:GUN4 domain-containing protein [Symploca sp. SIO1C4]
MRLNLRGSQEYLTPILWEKGQLIVKPSQPNPRSEDVIRTEARDIPKSITVEPEPKPPTPIIKSQQIYKTDDLSSERSVDYTKLRDLLAAGEWKQADEETFAVMLQATSRETQGDLDIESIENFPCTDLRTIDQLWVKYSNGRFGFSVQKRIWQSVSGKLGEVDWKIYRKYAKHVGWLVIEKKLLVLKGEKWIMYSECTFSLVAPEGHLPAFWSSPSGGGSNLRGANYNIFKNFDRQRQYYTMLDKGKKKVESLLLRRDL